MRTIICRFDSQSDLDDFNKLNNTNITKNFKTCNLDNNDYTEKKRNASKRAVNEDWKKFWLDMPNYYQPKQEAYAKIDFTTDKSTDELIKIFNQPVSDRTKSLWFPKLEQHTKRLYRVIGGDNPQYPIYVVSKNRADIKKAKTIFWLNKMEVNHFVVVEPDEYDSYVEAFKDQQYTKILMLNMAYKRKYDTLDNRGDEIGKGPGGARNFCWEHSVHNGYTHHWVLDDNIDGFHYLTHNVKWKMRTGVCFKAAEDFFLRFDNLAMGSLNYSKFVKEVDRTPAFVKNTRMYSIIFIKNDIPFRWRGRYNEDTILSLDVLSNGYCTVQLNCFLADKLTTQRVSGGNNDMFYKEEGTKNKTQMLVDVYPQYTKFVHKFNRDHHQVDYSSFTQELKYKDNIYIDRKENNYNMQIVKIPDEWDYTDKDCRSYIESHLDECEDVDWRSF